VAGGVLEEWDLEEEEGKKQKTKRREKAKHRVGRMRMRTIIMRWDERYRRREPSIRAPTPIAMIRNPIDPTKSSFTLHSQPPIPSSLHSFPLHYLHLAPAYPTPHPNTHKTPAI
jgi:hypothetical protein